MTDLEHGPRLRQLQSGYWVMVLPSERGARGKLHTRTASTGTKDREQAEACRRELMARQTPAADQITVGQLIAEYEQHAEERGVGPNFRYVMKPVKTLLSDYRPAQITLEVQRAYRAQRPISAPSHRRELGALIAVFNWAVKHRKLTPVEVPYIDLPANSAPRELFLDEAEEARLWGLAAADQDARGNLTMEALFVCLALGTGARSGAIKALTWDRIDLKAGTIDYRLPGERVTKKRKVKTVINCRLAPVLARAWGERQAVRQVTGCSNVRGRLEAFLKRHGFTHVTPHVFRHTFVTLSLRAGMSVWDVAGLAGMSPSVLQTVYGHHVTDARLRDAANRRFA